MSMGMRLTWAFASGFNHALVQMTAIKELQNWLPWRYALCDISRLSTRIRIMMMMMMIMIIIISVLLMIHLVEPWPTLRSRRLLQLQLSTLLRLTWMESAKTSGTTQNYVRCPALTRHYDQVTKNTPRFCIVNFYFKFIVTNRIERDFEESCLVTQGPHWRH